MGIYNPSFRIKIISNDRISLDNITYSGRHSSILNLLQETNKQRDRPKLVVIITIPKISKLSQLKESQRKS